MLDDTIVEADETFEVTLSDPSPSTAIAASTRAGAGSIVNDDVANAAPTVTVQNPVTGATAVAVSTNVWATFSEPVTGVDSTTFTVRNPAGSTISAVLTLSGLSATLNPSANLAADTSYTVTLVGGPAAIRDATGTPLATVSWTFLTGPGPKVNVTSPVHGALKAARGANVTATFSEQVTGVDTATFTLRTSAGAAVPAALTQSGKRWILNPNVTLAANTHYTVTLTGGATAIRDLAGNPLVTTTWTFTTV